MSNVIAEASSAGFGRARSSCVRRGGVATRPRDPWSAPRSTELAAVEDALAVDERADDLRLGDPIHRMFEQVAVEHGQVGALTDLDRAGLPVQVVHVGG